MLGEVAAYIDETIANSAETGALAVALPALGADMGRVFATPSNLRTKRRPRSRRAPRWPYTRVIQHEHQP